MNDTQPATDSSSADETDSSARSSRPWTPAFQEFMTQHWEQVDYAHAPLGTAPYAAERRARLSEKFPGKTIVIPAGSLTTRSNDTDYRFRPSSDFAYLTGLGADHEPDAVLVLWPTDSGDSHDAVLYVVPPAGPESEEFYTNPAAGEFWVGPRPSLEDFSVMTGLDTKPRSDLPAGTRTARQPVKAVRQFLSQMRMVKDDYEIQQLREAVDATIAGFARVAASLPRARDHKRGERVIESTFDGHAREEGNAVGYETIAAAGDHATTLHWIRNDGPVRTGDLLLLDAGVEMESLYTADITRTLPVSGEFSREQRQVYDVVLAAADAAFTQARPGNTLRDVHQAAMDVIRQELTSWGILPHAHDGEDLFRRWMVHGTSHHLGLDVHDCAHARRTTYLDGELRPGMVFTIEPGLYFKAHDQAAPTELRGIGVRIEDDILITDTGAENLSAALPRTAEDVEQWLRNHQA